MTLETLTTKESERLATLEGIVENGKSAFLAVGMALMQIKRDKLYRQDYLSFESYMEVRFDISKSRGYQLIAFAKDVEESTNCGRIPPKNECEARKARAAKKNLASVPTVQAKEVNEGGADAVGASVSPALTNDQRFMEAMGVTTLEQVESKPKEPLTVEYYARLETFVNDALENATDKQLASMSVYAATIPKIVKAELARRKENKS